MTRADGPDSPMGMMKLACLLISSRTFLIANSNWWFRVAIHLEPTAAGTCLRFEHPTLPSKPGAVIQALSADVDLPATNARGLDTAHERRGGGPSASRFFSRKTETGIFDWC
jgi:hypothetical protein